MVKLSDVKKNPTNPRVIKDEKFKSLVKSIREFPKMMALRPMVVDENDIVLGGNMRLKALQELGYTEIPEDWIRKASDLTEDEVRRFIIADNIGFGEWDFEMLQAEWDTEELELWGLDMPEPETEEPEKEPADPVADDYEQKFEVVAECESEEDQEKVFDLLTSNGYKCRVLQL